MARRASTPQNVSAQESGSFRPGPFGVLPWIVLSCSLLFTLLYLFNAPIGLDEFEFFKATRWVSLGRVPFRDFWEHHFPLQWYLQAPFVAWAPAASAATIVFMRISQAFFWIGSALLAAALLKRQRVSASVIVLVMALLFGARFFFRPLIEYRVDHPMNFFFLLGLLLLEIALEKHSARSWLPLIAGVSWALSCLCSQRMVPVVAAATILYLFSASHEAWGLRKNVGWAMAGGLAVAVLTILYFWFNHAFQAFWMDSIKQNLVFEALAEGTIPLLFWKKVAVLLGLYRDVPTVVLAASGSAAMILTFLDPRRPTLSMRLSLLIVLQLILFTRFSSPQPYQFQPILWMLALLTGKLIADRLPAEHRRRKLALAGLSLLFGCAVLIQTTLSFWTFVPQILARQDHVIRLVQEITGPEDRVLDGSGYGLEREPAFRYWFLPYLVDVLSSKGVIPPLTAADIQRSRPAAIVMDLRLRTLLEARGGAIVEEITRNYLPLESAVWIPAPNVLLRTEGSRYVWTILRSGPYRLVSADSMVNSPWFASPLSFSNIENLDRRHGIDHPERFELDTRRLPHASQEEGLHLTVNGEEIGANRKGIVQLEAGDEVEVRLLGPGPKVVILAPKRFPVFFQVPFPFVPLEPAFALQ